MDIVTFVVDTGSDGVPVGFALAETIGLPVGGTTGLPDGSPVGGTDGPSDDSPVGVTDGMPDGSPVGGTDGPSDGRLPCTVTVQDAVLAPLLVFTIITAEPVPTAVTAPPDTVAAFVLLDVQVTVLSVAFSGRIVSFS